MNEENMDNQVQELEYILPDDYEEEAEETTEAEVEESEEIEATEEVQEVAESLDDLEVKYLHDIKKLKDIPRDELKTLVQKGMNHDRITEKLNSNESTLEGFREIAEFYGYDIPTLTEALREQWFSYQAEQTGKTPNEVKLEYQLNKKTSSPTAKQDKAFDTLLSSYPDVKPESISEQTWLKFKDGVDLKTAYELQLKDNKLSDLESQLSKLSSELKAVKQNADVKKRGVVKPTTGNGSEDIEDDFLAGFFGK